jgi:predicted alpha/beta superfamily hydrolase
MISRRTVLRLAAALSAAPAFAHAAPEKDGPLVIGDTFFIDSGLLGERRRINVYEARAYGVGPEVPLPVLYMPDGGLAEDFLHVAGLLQVLVSNGGMRSFRLVGIENTQRRRDLTGPTDNAEDKKAAPVVGKSEAYRKFVRDELMPQVKSRYRCTAETAIVGESLAGLFVVETLLLEPAMFDTYIAFDPSTWWNDGKLLSGAGPLLRVHKRLDKTVYIALSSDAMAALPKLEAALGGNRVDGLRWQVLPMPEEKHATIYHPAALRAFRSAFKPG